MKKTLAELKLAFAEAKLEALELSLTKEQKALLALIDEGYAEGYARGREQGAKDALEKLAFIEDKSKAN